MVGRRENLLYPEFSADGLKELRSELRPIIRKYMSGWPIAEHPVFAKRLRDDKCGRGPKWHRTGEFGEPIRHYE
jgi:hypothetical protein